MPTSGRNYNSGLVGEDVVVVAPRIHSLGASTVDVAKSVLFAPLKSVYQINGQKICLSNQRSENMPIAVPTIVDRGSYSWKRFLLQSIFPPVVLCLAILSCYVV